MENPKYYRCINIQLGTGFTFGKIYEIRFPGNLNTFGNFVDDAGKPNGFGVNNNKSFTPVTEHEWNLQEGIITPVGKENHSQLSIILKKLKIK